jgi:hypothetical protein
MFPEDSMGKVRVTGAELIRFYEEWPMGPDTAYDEAPFSEEAGALRWVDGCDEAEWEHAPIIDPARTYTIEYGILWWQGSTPQPPDFCDSIVRALSRWKKAQTTSVFTLEIPNDQAEEFRRLCAERKWKLIK